MNSFFFFRLLHIYIYFQLSPLLVLDKTGRYVRGFGNGTIKTVHGMRMQHTAARDVLWVTDSAASVSDSLTGTKYFRHLRHLVAPGSISRAHVHRSTFSQGRSAAPENVYARVAKVHVLV